MARKKTISDESMRLNDVPDEGAKPDEGLSDLNDNRRVIRADAPGAFGGFG